MIKTINIFDDASIRYFSPVLTDINKNFVMSVMNLYGIIFTRKIPTVADWQTFSELGCCGYFTFFRNEKCKFLHLLFSEFDWGKELL